MKKITALLLAFALLFLAAACAAGDIARAPSVQNFIKTVRRESLSDKADDKDSAGTIKIGIFEPLSGQYAADAEDELKGIELAHRLFPRVLAKRVELVYADNESDINKAVSAAEKLIAEGCKIVIGSYGNILTMAACDYFEDSAVPVVMPSCTNPLLTSTTEYFFRVCIFDAFQGNSAAKYITEYLPGVLHPAVADDPATDEDETAKGGEPVNCLVLKKAGDERAAALIERFQAKMEEVRGEEGYVKVIEYPEGCTDFTPYFERLKSQGAEIVYFPSSAAEGEAVLYEAYQSGYAFNWVGVSVWSGLLDAASKAGRSDFSHIDNAAYVAAFDKKSAATSVTEDFLSAARTYYRNDSPSENMALGFDAYLIALQGLRDAASINSGADIRFALNRLWKMDGATGQITYRSGTGDPVKDVVIEKFENGNVVADYVARPNLGD